MRKKNETEEETSRARFFRRTNLRSGTDEPESLANFRLPRAAIAPIRIKSRSVFEDEIFDKGNQQIVKRKLVVSASDAFGYPLSLDSDVLLVLMHLTDARHELPDSDGSVYARYELVKFLGWENNGERVTDGWKNPYSGGQASLFFTTGPGGTAIAADGELTFQCARVTGPPRRKEISGSPDDDGQVVVHLEQGASFGCFRRTT